MKHIVRRHTISFKNAFNGLLWALKTQPNYTIHVLLSALVVCAGVYFYISTTEWLFLVLTIALGLTIETINTAIEVTTDVIDTKIRDDIKIAKDVAAAAMLSYAFGAAIIAAIIFIPKIMLRFLF